MYLYAYNMGSEGSKLLANALKVKRIRQENSEFRGNQKKVVINWGSSEVNDEVKKCKIINHPDKLVKATDKLQFFQKLSTITDGPRLVPWTTSRDEAVKWFRDKKNVVARTVLNGSSGNGIRIYDNNYGEGDIVNCRLYTQYIPKKDEYRVHFVNGQIIDYQRKALRPGFDVERVNWKVRNLDNGFIFVRNDVELPDDVRIQAEKTIKGIDLDFGAIDIIWNEKEKEAYVLEVNTAPGLVGTTLENYAKAFEQYRENNETV